MEQPCISVIVPVYQVQEYLDECVQSLVSQTYKNLEILLIDDGSTDGSGALCDAWAQKDARIRVFHTKNYGVSHARNVGLDAATGDYIGFIDPDDWIDADMYELMLQEMLEKNTDVCGGGYVCEGEASKWLILQKRKPRVFTREEILLEIFRFRVPKCLTWVLWDKLFRKELVTKIRFDEEIHNGEDKIFFWDIMQNVKTFSYLPLEKYHYRMRQNSAVHTVSGKKFTACMANRNLWESSAGETTELCCALLDWYLNAMRYVTYNMFQSNPKKYKQRITENQAELRKHFFSVLRLKNYSKREWMYILIFMLPYRVCAWLFKMKENWKRLRKCF